MCFFEATRVPIDAQEVALHADEAMFVPLNLFFLGRKRSFNADVSSCNTLDNKKPVSTQTLKNTSSTVVIANHRQVPMRTPQEPC